MYACCMHEMATLATSQYLNSEDGVLKKQQLKSSTEELAVRAIIMHSWMYLRARLGPGVYKSCLRV